MWPQIRSQLFKTYRARQQVLLENSYTQWHDHSIVWDDSVLYMAAWLTEAPSASKIKTATEVWSLCKGQEYSR